MADSDTPLFRDRPDWNSPAEEPLGLKNPLLPARSLGLNQRFLVPLGAQSLSVLDASIFQSDGIQRDFLDNPFHDSPFFSDVDSTSISVDAVSVDAVSVDGLSSQGKKAQDAIQLQQSPAATLGSTSPEPQVLRNEVPQSEEMQGQRSQLPAEPQQSTSEPDIQRSPDKAFAPSSKNISESPDQPQQLTSQSNNPALNVEATQQTSSGKKEQPSFSETSQIKETQPSSQPLQAEAEIQLSQDKISSLSSEKVSAALVQPQKSINQSSEPELDSKPEYRSTPSENIQLFASSENKIQIPQTLQSSDQETQLLQEISSKQSSDASIQPQQLSSQVSSLELNNIEPNSLKIDGRSIQQINTQKTDVSENSQSHFADEINLESPQSLIQPSRSPTHSTSESTFGQSNSSLELSASLETSLLDLNQTSQSLETTQSNADIQATAIIQPSQDNLLRSPIEPTATEPLSIEPLVTDFIAETQPQPIQAKFETDELLLQQDLQTTQIDNSNTLLIPNNDVSDVSSENIQRFASEAIAPQQTDDVKTSEATLALSSISAEPARSSEFVIQPSRSPSSSESSPLDSTQPVHNLDIAAQPNSELPTFNLEQVVPSNHVSPIQKTSEHDEIALTTSAERSANPLLQTANEIIQPKIIVSNNSANDEISTNIDNTVQQSASNAIASSLPVDSISTTPSKSQLENNELILQQPPIAVQAQIVETTEIESKLTDAIQKKELGKTESSLGKTLESVTTPVVEQLAISNEAPTVQAAEEPAIHETLAQLSTGLPTRIAPNLDLQSIKNTEVTKSSLESISTENLNSSASAQTHSNDLSNSSNPLSRVLTSDPTESNQSSELALSNFQQAENAPMIQPQLAENDAKEITQLATTPSPSSEELEVSAPSTRSLQPTLEATREPVLQQQPESITDTADNELSLLQRSPIAEQSSSEEMLVASEAMTEPSATKIEPLISEVSPVVSRAVDLSFETANSNGVEIEPISLEAPLESQAESLQLKALTESADSLDTNAQVSNSPQALNESSDTGSNPQAQENVSNQISVDAVQQLSRSVDDVSEQKTGRSQNRLEQTQALPKNESVISENLITSLAPIAQELQLDSNESIQRTSEITSASSSVAPIETTEMGDRAANQNFPEIITEQSSPVDLNTSEIVDSVASKDSLQATVSIHEPSMVDVSKSVLSFGNAFTQATIEQSRISEPQVAQPIQRSPQSFLNQADSITADSVVNLATTSADEVLSQLTQDDTFQSSNIVNQTNIPSEIGSTSEEAIQRTIQQSEIGSANIEENTQQEIQKSQPQVDSEQIKLEPFIQRSPTLENTAIASPTQPQIIQVRTSELPTLQSDFTSAENSNSPFINQAANPQITSEPSVNQMIDLRSDRAVQADVANLMQPNTSVEQPTTIIQAKPDIQPNQAIDDRAPSAIDIQSLVQKATTEPAAIQLQQTTDNRMSSAIDVTPTSTPSIHPSAPLFDSPSSIPETAIQRSLESLDTKPNSPAIQTNQPDSIPELPQVLQNLTVLRSLTQPQALGGSDATVQAKSLQSQSLQATPRQAISTINLPLVSAIPTANVPAASSIEQSVLNRKPEPVKVAATSSDRLSRQWSTLNELVQGQTVPSRRTSVAKPAPSQKPSSAKVTNPTIQAKLSESSTPVRVTRQSSPTIRREGNEFQDEDFDDIDYLEALAQAIYDRLRQRMRIEQERHGRDYSGRLPW